MEKTGNLQIWGSAAAPGSSLHQRSCAVKGRSCARRQSSAAAPKTAQLRRD